MKKLHKKGTVHPSPPVISDHLSFLPATILTLAAALPPEDRELLAYLISSSSANFSGNRSNTHTTTGGGDHSPSFNCKCFRCYTSYWVRWDSSPSRQLIHEIIDAFEDGLAQTDQSKKDKNKKERRKRGSKTKGLDELTRIELTPSKGESDSVEEICDCGGVGGQEFEKGSVMKFVSFIGERLWSVWT